MHSPIASYGICCIVVVGVGDISGVAACLVYVLLAIGGSTVTFRVWPDAFSSYSPMFRALSAASFAILAQNSRHHLF